MAEEHPRSTTLYAVRWENWRAGYPRCSGGLPAALIICAETAKLDTLRPDWASCRPWASTACSSSASGRWTIFKNRNVPGGWRWIARNCSGSSNLGLSPFLILVQPDAGSSPCFALGGPPPVPVGAALSIQPECGIEAVGRHAAGRGVAPGNPPVHRPQPLAHRRLAAVGRHAHDHSPAISAVHPCVKLPHRVLFLAGTCWRRPFNWCSAWPRSRSPWPCSGRPRK